ncbi:cryptochrome/photolyase family protein [Agrobacterium rubi]|uniref:Deoxyribodipyrimidine photo-lyase n=1 Tax=Agrobacterium rubi TaxID=28099 RepID=A0AAE7R3D9_9HYPH|nr:deoxyribodipyrimidine photo-lyase [Agrobacterium rubi]NTE86083.1 deoxyribodipyrimidine photo-lyase [Agrobacterium rubi]NTF02014.1 deoxyribodipyrimidine photo-lyase [Agrobacterium rubi]NTF36258.1 deoxyribodipyrimidine photo-lyase [Agrobacterium rubi]OCJ54580.1 deoxyribodipyrimidine photolyase [Agrobacterium rubi]QTG01338.1 deoxyribodipyrimidine photo-lyase [Agrobacterium rubi]
MTEQKNPVIVFFRKDLRLSDNRALSAAADHGGPVIPVYIHDDKSDSQGALGSAQAWWLHHSLAALSTALESVGSKLILMSGSTETVLQSLIDDTGAEAIFWNRRYDPDGIETDTRLKQKFRDNGVVVESFAGHLLHEPSKLKTKSGGPYRVYTPFWRAIEGGEEPAEPLAPLTKLPRPARWPKSEELKNWHLLPSKPDWAKEFSDIWTPGEAGASENLETFIDSALKGYEEGRDFPAQPATSMLSPHLAMGEISPAQVWNATRGLPRTIASNDLSRFRKEIVWRDFCYHLLFHFPQLDEKNWNSNFDAFEWKNDDAKFKAWTRGMTGYPIVDAGMRQLWRHGVMHNRVRMITASFLIKHLLIDWRKGEKWFRDTLVDADPASNPGNWQWVAGSGADASPFFRIFNPILQGEKFDPDGEYVKTFVPELSKLDKKFIHKPFDAPKEALQKAGIELGKAYPKPIVDHSEARQRALAAYSDLKKGE